MSVGDLIDEGRLLRVEADPRAARSLLTAAKRHLESAEAIGDADRSGAYQLAYDAARKAITAHMAFTGLRVRSGEGAHAVTARYVEAAIDDPAVGHFDRMRRNRNRVEYAAGAVGAAQFDADFDRARRIVAVVEGALR